MGNCRWRSRAWGKIEQALIREVWEETGLEIVKYKPLFFDDDQGWKLYPDGHREEQYLVYLLFGVVAKGKVKLNKEWSEFAWVPQTRLNAYDLNPPTLKNFKKLGLL